MSNLRIRRWPLAAVVALGVLFVPGALPASAAVNVMTVTGSALGYHSFGITLFGGAQSDVGPTPTVSLASNASNSPQAATSPTGIVAYGPATLFTSDAISLTTTGSLGTSGKVTTTSSVNNINKATTQPSSTGSEELTADNISSSCSASSSAAVTGSTSVTNGNVQTLSGDADPNPPTRVNVPTSPTPNYTVNGQIDLSTTDTESFSFVFNEQSTDSSGNLTINAVHENFLGPTLKGNLIIGQVVCGLTPAAADLSVRNPGITHSPNPVPARHPVTFTITVSNLGPNAAAAVSDVTTWKGAKFASATSSAGTCMKATTGNKVTCTLGTVANGGAVTINLTLTAPRTSGASISVTSKVAYSGDVNSANNSATDSVLVQ